MSLAAMLVDGGFASYAAALTSSHFLLGGAPVPQPSGVRWAKAPTAQWTTTGSGAIILSRKGTGPFITHVTTGKVVDKGITDANNMGLPWPPPPTPHSTPILRKPDAPPDFYDLIVTGDLGQPGKGNCHRLFPTGWPLT